jgi:hypothetical protein
VDNRAIRAFDRLILLSDRSILTSYLPIFALNRTVSETDRPIRTFNGLIIGHKGTQGTQKLRPEIFVIFCGSIVRMRRCGAAFYRGYACRQFGEAANAFLPNWEGPPLVVL